ncbi:hypothetical protein KPH14_001846 [Odynerus spinipes]|uniref:Uncharacterized protein n=1 Tax=Odynerus spinipes TaxID=1348599 RepID=A0AAD9RZU9_9HYME|nr:hypothetical protein KPH14_001846 [Odynerus spinipes]
MKLIGWTLTCLLLAFFSKNVLSDDDPTLGEHESNVIDQNEGSRITRLTPLSKISTMDSDVLDLRQFLEEIFVGNKTEGVILLVLKLSTFLAKFYAGWNQHHAPHSWSPQPIHVHVHNDLPYAHGQAYHGWEAASGPTDDEHYYYKG